MSTFWKNFKEKRALKSDPSSPRYRRYMAERICGHHIKYVTERIDNVETVIGREGGLNIRGDEFLVFASAKVIFRAKIDEMQAGELLSHDGVVLSAPDLDSDGKERTIIVHFTDYFK